MAFIKVPIVCNVDNIEIDTVNELLESLDLPIDGEDIQETEIRYGKLNTQYIISYYPNSNRGRTTVNDIDSQTIVDMPYSKFDKLVEDANA